MKFSGICLSLALFVCGLITLAPRTLFAFAGDSADASLTLKYAGYVSDASELKTQLVGVTFAIYKEKEGGTSLWMETQNVHLDATGHFTILLGQETMGGLPAGLLPPGEARWLGIQVERRAEQDRTLLPATQAYIYWTNSKNGSVGRAKIDGTGANESFIHSTTGGAVGGAGMTMNKQYLYWTSANGGTATTILRAKIDGTNVNKNFITGAHNPCGMTVDSSSLYWGGDVGTAIGRANLDGSHVNRNFITTGTGVCGVVVTKFHIYWANYQTNWIGVANLDGSHANPNFIPTSGASSLAIEGQYIYWPNNGTAIGRAKLNGTDVNQKLITGLNGEVAFIAVDSAYIYWADWGNRDTGTTIGRAKLDGTGVNQKFIKGTLGGFGLAVTGGSPFMAGTN